MSDSPALPRPAIAPAPVRERAAGPPQLVLLLAASSMSVLGAVLLSPVLPQMAQHFAGVPGVAAAVMAVVTAVALRRHHRPLAGRD